MEPQTQARNCYKHIVSNMNSSKSLILGKGINWARQPYNKTKLIKLKDHCTNCLYSKCHYWCQMHATPNCYAGHTCLAFRKVKCVPASFS